MKDSQPVPQIEAEKVNEEVGILKVDEDNAGRVEITRELKLNEVSEGGRDLNVEVDKNSDGSSSSSSSSDDEGANTEKTQVVLDLPEVVEDYEVENSVDSQVTTVVLEGLVDTADESPVASVVFEELVESAVDSQVPAAVLEELVETADDSPMPSVVLDEVVETSDESQVPAVVLEEVVYVSETAPDKEVYETLDKPVLSELNSELKTVEDGDLPMTLPAVVSHGETSNINPFTVKDAEDNVLPPLDSPTAATRNGVGQHPKSPEIQDSLDIQTPLLQAPLSVQRASWKGCCGLFEVFSGSR